MNSELQIVAWYSVDLPQEPPPDPLVVSTEIYVEVGPGSRPACFDYTLSLRVCTTGFILSEVRERGRFAAKHLLMIERFDNDLISAKLRELLPQLLEIAERK